MNLNFVWNILFFLFLIFGNIFIWVLLNFIYLINGLFKVCILLVKILFFVLISFGRVCAYFFNHEIFCLLSFIFWFLGFDFRLQLQFLNRFSSKSSIDLLKGHPSWIFLDYFLLFNFILWFDSTICDIKHDFIVITNHLK
jgi:hypothetical protein